jgi:hypothetical protein
MWRETGLLGLSATCRTTPQWLRNDTQHARDVVININSTTDLRTPGTVQQAHPNPALRIFPHTRYISTHSLPQKHFTIRAPRVQQLNKNRLLATSKPSGHLRTIRFNIQQLYLLPTQCICVFCVDLRTNRDYFPIQH